jgi:hypothetical protein
MRLALSTNHYASGWKRPDNTLEAVTALGIRYASMPDGLEREDVLLTIIRCFHPYIFKYVDMIIRGHLPSYRHHVNKDSANFLRCFTKGGGDTTTQGLQLTCRTMHLAFKDQTYDEVYNILVVLLIKVIHAYDPTYTDKVKLVSEAIEKLDPEHVIAGDELGLDFDPRRFLRWMTRNEILVAVRNPKQERFRFPPRANYL